MSGPSSKDLHPSEGARFVFERIDEGGSPRYRVEVFLPGERGWSGELSWVDDAARLDAADPAGDDDELRWSREEALKLARVLHRDPKQRLTRWRGR